MKKITLFGVTAAMLLSSATGAFAAVETFTPDEKTGLYTVTADVAGVQKDAMYGVLAVAGDVLSETIDEEDITYIDQITATEAGKFSLANFGLKADAPNSTLYIGGAGLDGATEVAKLAVESITVEDYTISGVTTSVNGTKSIVVKLFELVDGVPVLVECEPTYGDVSYNTDSGIATQTFSVTVPKAGVYKIEITKTSHLKYVVTDIEVADKSVDFTQSVGAPYANIKLLAGDVDGDGNINVTDIGVIKLINNYYKPTSAVETPEADVDGDGNVNVTDVGIVRTVDNYYKNTAADCTHAYVVPAE